MEIFEYLTGQGGLMLLALVAAITFVVKKYKNWRYFKHIQKQRENKDN